MRRCGCARNHLPVDKVAVRRNTGPAKHWAGKTRRSPRRIRRHHRLLHLHSQAQSASYAETSLWADYRQRVQEDPLDAAQLFHRVRQELADGRSAQALEYCLETLAIAQRTTGPSLDTVAILNTLSEIRLDLSDYPEALDASEQAFAMVSALTVEAEDAGVLALIRVQTIAALARVERTLGRLDEAERHYLGALAEAEILVGDDNEVSLAPLLNDLAVVYKYAARYDEGIALYWRALAAIESTLGPEHPEAATVWHNLAGIEHARGQHAAGEPYARRSVQIREAALGPKHPAVAADVAALAALVQEQGRLDEADTLYRRALGVLESVYGPDHYDVAVCCNNLGALLVARGRHDDAEAFYRRALTIKENLLGTQHPDVAVTLHNLAVLHIGAGRSEQAKLLFARALNIFVAQLGPEHPKSLATREELTHLT